MSCANHPLQSISKADEQIKKSRKIASPQITAHVSWKFPNEMREPLDFKNGIYGFST